MLIMLMIVILPVLLAAVVSLRYSQQQQQQLQVNPKHNSAHRHHCRVAAALPATEYPSDLCAKEKEAAFSFFFFFFSFVPRATFTSCSCSCFSGLVSAAPLLFLHPCLGSPSLSLFYSLSQCQWHKYLAAWRLAGCILESEASVRSLTHSLRCVKCVSLPHPLFPPPLLGPCRSLERSGTHAHVVEGERETHREREKQREGRRERAPCLLVFLRHPRPASSLLRPSKRNRLPPPTRLLLLHPHLLLLLLLLLLLGCPSGLGC